MATVKKEHIIKMVTDTEFETGIIRGKLNSLIIDSEDYVSVTIESSLGYLIFNNSSHQGIKYYAPRALLQGSQANIMVQDQFDKFKLNERVMIRIAGPADAEVSIILRFD